MMCLRTSLLLFYLLGMIYCDLVPLKMLDLTRTFNNNTEYWPGQRKFEMTYTERGTQRGFWLQLEEYSSTVHAGTHLDAPCEMIRGNWCVDQIPINRLVAPAAVIDITRQVKGNRDYGATIQDLQKWERKNQRTLDGMIVLLKSGWGKRYGNVKAFTGTADEDETKLHFPGISPRAAQWIVDYRKVIAVGGEALSLDVGPNVQFPAHRILFSANIYALNCIANMDKLPEIGATLHAFPMKIGSAGGAPVRIIAMLPNHRRQ